MPDPRGTSTGAWLACALLLLGALFAGPALADEPAAPGGTPRMPGVQTGEYKFEFPPDLPFDPAGWTTRTDYPPVGDPRAKRVRGRTFTHVWAAFPTTLRMHGPNSRLTIKSTLEALVYESLLQWNPDIDEFIPGLASHWKIEDHPDGTQTFTFHIDERARFSTGEPVEADDVYYSFWHRVQADRQDPSSTMTFSEGFETPKVLDRRTVSVKTKKANWRLFLYFVASAMYIQPARELAITGERYLEDYNWKLMTGSGPYVLAEGELKKGESLTLTRRDDWWAENEPWAKHTHNFDRVKFVVIQEVELAYEKLKKGDLDWFQIGQARRWVQDVPKEEKVQKGWIQRRKIFNKRPVGFSGLAFNQQKPPFDDLRVRKAFAHLFHRERLMEKLFFNEYELTNSTYPASDWGSGDERETVVYDPILAEELLAEAGYSKRDSEGWLVGPGGQRLEVTLDLESAVLEPIFLVVKEDYEKAGVKFNLRRVDPSTIQQRVGERQFTIRYQSWGAILFPNPETSWRSSLADQLHNNNITGFKDARVDELCEKYNVAKTWDERKAIIREIDTRVCEQHPYAFGWHARSDRILYWHRFGHPPEYMNKITQHPEDSMLVTWWFDEEKEKRLQAAMAADQPLPQDEPVPEDGVNIRPWDR